MSRIIAIASGKGGVGKTTITANLAAALAKMDRNVIAVDGNIGTANLGIHLGVPLFPVTLQDVLKRDSKLRDALYFHKAGFRVLPANVSLKKAINPKSHQFMNLFYKLVNDADYVLIDCPPGIGQETRNVIEACDELITITNPEVPAMTDAVKLGAVSEQIGTKNIGVVINRINRHKHEINLDVATRFLGMNVIGKIREDKHVAKSTAFREPVITYKPGSRASKQIMELASVICGKPVPKQKFSLFSKLR